ncbi:MAG: hypothetical protein QG653_337, partial [Patescibacteria group bacterium]|nr:hypothetical protein [Patescibacteria group bacterium]
MSMVKKKALTHISVCKRLYRMC